MSAVSFHEVKASPSSSSEGPETTFSSVVPEEISQAFQTCRSVLMSEKSSIEFLTAQWGSRYEFSLIEGELCCKEKENRYDFGTTSRTFSDENFGSDSSFGGDVGLQNSSAISPVDSKTHIDADPVESELNMGNECEVEAEEVESAFTENLEAGPSGETGALEAAECDLEDLTLAGVDLELEDELAEFKTEAVRVWDDENLEAHGTEFEGLAWPEDDSELEIQHVENNRTEDAEANRDWEIEALESADIEFEDATIFEDDLELGEASGPSTGSASTLDNSQDGVVNVMDTISLYGHDEDFTPCETDEFVPTDAPAGSREKIEVLRRRVELGIPLWHRDDRADYSGLSGVIGPRITDS